MREMDRAKFLKCQSLNEKIEDLEKAQKYLEERDIEFFVDCEEYLLQRVLEECKAEFLEIIYKKKQELEEDFKKI